MGATLDSGEHLCTEICSTIRDTGLHTLDRRGKDFRGFGHEIGCFCPQNNSVYERNESLWSCIAVTASVTLSDMLCSGTIVARELHNGHVHLFTCDPAENSAGGRKLNVCVMYLI